MTQNSLNRTILTAPIAQGAAGATDLLVAQGADIRIYVVTIALSLDAAGSLKFQENGATDLSGAFPIAANAGFVIAGNGQDPVLATNTPGVKLNIVTVAGKAFGFFRYFLDR